VFSKIVRILQRSNSYHVFATQRKISICILFLFFTHMIFPDKKECIKRIQLWNIYSAQTSIIQQAVNKKREKFSYASLSHSSLPKKKDVCHINAHCVKRESFFYPIAFTIRNKKEEHFPYSKSLGCEWLYGKWLLINMHAHLLRCIWDFIPPFYALNLPHNLLSLSEGIWKIISMWWNKDFCFLAYFWGKWGQLLSVFLSVNF
jgi:hypothetical protein